MTWQLALIIGCVLTPLSWACLWIGLRAHRQTSAWMSGNAEPEMTAAWPLSGGDDGAAVPYLRGGSHAAGLTGRR